MEEQTNYREPENLKYSRRFVKYRIRVRAVSGRGGNMRRIYTTKEIMKTECVHIKRIRSMKRVKEVNQVIFKK